MRGNQRKMGQTRQKGLASQETQRRKQLRFYWTRFRELKSIAKALLSTRHPFLVHIIPMRRCNLDCGYCNEYDDVSQPVPLEEMKRRLDALANMGSSIITISGGEPLLHPDLDDIIGHIRRRGMIAGMITNGREHDWKCRAGSRYLYICENGLVHWCSQQRGYPGIPLESYTAEMRRREFHTHKGCAPMCTVSCVQQVGILDNWRAPQTLQPEPVSAPKSDLVQIAK